MNYKKLTKYTKMTGNEYLDTWLTHLGFNSDTIQNLDAPEKPFHENEILKKTLAQLKLAHEKGYRIMVSADYDNDGIYGGTILVHGLRFLGFDVSYMIPDRIKDGYGMNRRLVDRAIQENCQMIMTVDNGIACKDAVMHALENGVEVIVTDHHEIPEDDTKNVLKIEGINVIHPNTVRGEEEFRAISGATVAYKFMEYLFHNFEVDTYQDELEFYRALAGVTVISDVMPLLDENRTIFKRAVQYIKDRRNEALDYFVSHLPNVDFEHLDETTFGFSICPVVNAIGRLDNAEVGIQYFDVDPEDREHYLALFVSTNERRKTLQNSYVKRVEQKVDTTEAGICYFDEDKLIHEGLVGILAGRICNNHYKPTIVFSQTEEGNWKGSGRSTEQVSIINVLNKINDEDSDIFISFGGHAGAAGISIRADKRNEFVKLFNKYVLETASEEATCYYVDVKATEVPSLIQQMKKLKPWGNSFPKPIIHVNFDLNILKAYFGSQRGIISNDVFDLWVDLPTYLQMVRDHQYKVVFSNYQKLLFEGDLDAESDKTEFYKANGNKICLSMFGEVTSNYFGGKEQIKFDVVEIEK